MLLLMSSGEGLTGEGLTVYVLLLMSSGADSIRVVANVLR